MEILRKGNRSGKKWLRMVVLVLLIALAGAGANTGHVTALAAKSAAVKNGWSKDKNYYYKDGKKVTGLYKIGKKTYYFGTKGKLVRERRALLIKVKGKKYYYNIDTKGVAKKWTGTAQLAAKRLVALKANLNTVTEKKMEKSLKKAFLWAADLKYRDNTVSKTGNAAFNY